MKVGCESSGCQHDKILLQSNKNGEKINEQFCCEIWKKFDLDRDI
jgi:hypothetical protein